MAEQFARKSNGDDIEPVGEARADVEMGNEEDAACVEFRGVGGQHRSELVEEKRRLRS